MINSANNDITYVSFIKDDTVTVSIEYVLGTTEKITAGLTIDTPTEKVITVNLKVNEINESISTAADVIDIITSTQDTSAILWALKATTDTSSNGLVIELPLTALSTPISSDEFLFDDSNDVTPDSFGFSELSSWYDTINNKIFENKANLDKNEEVFVDNIKKILELFENTYITNDFEFDLNVVGGLIDSVFKTDLDNFIDRFMIGKKLAVDIPTQENIIAYSDLTQESYRILNGLLSDIDYFFWVLSGMNTPSIALYTTPSLALYATSPGAVNKLPILEMINYVKPYYARFREYLEQLVIEDVLPHKFGISDVLYQGFGIRSIENYNITDLARFKFEQQTNEMTYYNCQNLDTGCVFDQPVVGDRFNVIDPDLTGVAQYLLYYDETADPDTDPTDHHYKLR